MHKLAAGDGGGAELAFDHAAAASLPIITVRIRGDHDADADVSVIAAVVDNIRGLGNLLAGNHVFAALSDVVGVVRSIRLDLFISENRSAVGDILHAIRGSGRSRNRGIAGAAGALTVVSGLDQVDLDITDGEGVGGRIGVGEVRKRCAHDGDRRESDTQEDRGQFLFHVCLLLLCSICAARRGEPY